MDFDLFGAINGFTAHHDWAEDPLRFFAVQAQVFFVLLLAGLFLVRGKWRSLAGRHGVIAAGFSAALALGLAGLVVGGVQGLIPRDQWRRVQVDGSIVRFNMRALPRNQTGIGWALAF